MKANKLMYGLMFVACAGLTTACEEGEDFTKEQALAAFTASDETVASLEADIASEQSIKIIAKMNELKGGNKASTLTPNLYTDFLFYGNAKLEAGKAYTLNGTEPTIKGDLSKSDASSISFTMDNSTAFVLYDNMKTGTEPGAEVSICYPDSNTCILSSVACNATSTNDWSHSNYSIPLKDKKITITYAYGISDGVSVDVGGIAVTVGSGSTEGTGRTFSILRSDKASYSFTEAQTKEFDITEITWGEIWLHIDGVGKITKSTDIEIKAIKGSTRHAIGKLNTGTGTITYADGQTGQAANDMPGLYAHLKMLFGI